MKLVINLHIDCSIEIPRERISLSSSVIIVSFLKQFQNNVIFVISITAYQTDNKSNGQFIILASLFIEKFYKKFCYAQTKCVTTKIFLRAVNKIAAYTSKLWASITGC